MNPNHSRIPCRALQVLLLLTPLAQSALAEQPSPTPTEYEIGGRTKKSQAVPEANYYRPANPQKAWGGQKDYKWGGNSSSPKRSSTKKSASSDTGRASPTPSSSPSKKKPGPADDRPSPSPTPTVSPLPNTQQQTKPIPTPRPTESSQPNQPTPHSTERPK
jgi:hypothetical protein